MFILTLLLLLAAPLAAAEDTFTGVERVVAVGDVHGDYGAFQTILRDAGLIDQKSRWIGGKAHLVQTGDILDRGSDSRKVIELLLNLEKQASKAGGRVHSLIGNHEVMNMYGDLRYVTPGEYAAFRTGDSQSIRDRFWEREVEALGRTPTPEERKRWEADHPLGWVEHRMQYGSEGAYGKWMRAKNAVVKINDSIFLHGGISAKYADMSVTEINDAIRAEIKDVSKIKAATSIVTEPDGPLWYRGLAQDSSPEVIALVDKLLEKHGVKRIVIGHTPTPGAVLPRFGGKVLAIDVGLSAYYGSNRACLLIEGEKLFAIHRGKKVDFPGAEPVAVLAYVKEVAALEPPSSPLRKLVPGQ